MAANGPEAAEAVERERFDAIGMDIETVQPVPDAQSLFFRCEGLESFPVERSQR